MYADPHALLRLADDLRRRGEQVRRLADALGREAASVEWHGSSADSMRRLARAARANLLDLADAHDRVADLLSDHAHRIAGRLGIAVGVLHWLEEVA